MSWTFNNKNNLAIGYHPLKDNYGYAIDKIPTTLLEELTPIVNSLQSDFSQGVKFNDNLAGEIKHEFKITPTLKNINYFKSLVNKFESYSKYISTNYNPIPTLSLTELWVNFQQKHEYNPPHVHHGILSFVIWYQVPYTIAQERLQYGYKSNPQEITHGQFHFMYPSSPYDVDYTALDVDKLMEGRIAIFPSNLTHSVYPFYSSDEYRITIAGNITENK